jgi:hypothetical protein
MNETTTLPPVEGGCLCGALRYRARPTHRNGYYCHCRMCQLACGNTRATFINLRKDEVEWLRGAPAYFASSKFARRSFCGDCGTPLGFEFLDSANMDLTVGSLDEPAAFAPTSHFAVESRIAAWHAEDGLPGERLDTNAKMIARWRDAYGADAAAGIETTRRG